jgi:hypothetical protein
MKLAIIILSIVTCLSTFAASELYCKASNDTLVPMSDEENFYDYCSDKMYVQGAVCFTGSRKGTIALLKELNDWDIYGGEASFIAIHYKGKSEIAYKLLDGPSEQIVFETAIKRCK